MLRLQEIRKARGQNQKALADFMGVSRSTIAMWETGGSQPDPDTLSKLADYFGVSVDYLLGREVTLVKGLDQMLRKHDMSQKQFAAEMGVSAPTVSEWVKGKKSPSGKNLDKMIAMFGCTYDEILMEQKDAAEIDDATLDAELITMLTRLDPSEIQRVTDFVSGILASRRV